MFDRTRPPPPIVTWAVLLTALFAAPACTYLISGDTPERLELRAQPVLDRQAEAAAQAYRPRVLSPLGFLVRNEVPPPPPATVLTEVGGLGAFCESGVPEADAIDSLCGALRQAGWARTGALGALGTGILIVLLILGGRLLVRGPRPLQRVAWVEGWAALRWLATGQFLANTVLGLWSLYWAAVLIFDADPSFGSLAFAVMTGLYALAMVLNLHGHQQLDLRVWFDEAEVLGPDAAPELFTHLGVLADRVGVSPPDQLIVGLEPGVYLLDGAAMWGGEKVSGRSLYLGAEPLKRLSREELDALVLHELAHLSRGPSEHPRALHQQRKHLESVLVGLEPAAFLSPANAVMRVYCEGVLAAERVRARHAERAADGLAAQFSSTETFARALVKLVAFSSFHERTTDAIYEQEAKGGRAPSLAQALQTGFEDYSRSRQLVRDVRTAELGHPLDRHAPLPERLEALGESALLEHLPLRFFEAPRQTWFHTIPSAERLVRELWTERAEEEREVQEAEAQEREREEREEREAQDAGPRAS